MNETFYVKITTKKPSRDWYTIGDVFCVNGETKGKTGDYCFFERESRICLYAIPKSDCSLVYLTEQPTDCDGEPLECGDEVECNSIQNKSYTFVGMYKHLYVIVNDKYDYSHSANIRKVKTEPVASIGDIIKDIKSLKENAYELRRSTFDKIIFRLEQHMEAKGKLCKQNK